MNRFRRIVLAGAFINIVVLLMFPPYDVPALGRGLPNFDAFYPVFAVPAGRFINGDLLYILIFAVLVNALVAWLLLGRRPGKADATLIEPGIVVIALAIVNLAAAFLFPPMEAFPFAQRVTVGTFDGFYFAFGDKSRRAIFVPLLYLEVIFILANALAFWLAMSVASRRGAAGPEMGALTMLDESALLRARAEAKLGGKAASLPKRGAERRSRRDPGYPGPERRRNSERRRR